MAVDARLIAESRNVHLEGVDHGRRELEIVVPKLFIKIVSANN